MCRSGSLCQDEKRQVSVYGEDVYKRQAHPMHPKDGSVELEQVHFSYNGEKDVLNGISISIPAGQTVAFVGPSGGGKTTLANLISRFFDPQSGTVRAVSYTHLDVYKRQLLPNRVCQEAAAPHSRRKSSIKSIT